MVGVLFSDVLDAKVANDEGEKVRLGVVLPHRWSYGHRGKTELGEVIFESVVGDAADLLEAGHAFSDLEVDPAVGTERAEAVIFNDFIWDEGYGEFNILVPGHGGSVVKILDVQGHEAGTRGRYGAVEEALCCC